MSRKLRIIPSDLLQKYKESISKNLEEDFSALEDSELSIDKFSFYTSVSAVFSSKIEGEEIELDSYVKHKRYGIEYQPDYTRKIDDLYEAYLYAQNNPLNEKNLATAHALITKHILRKSQQGVIRKGNMYVISTDGNIDYVAAPPDIVSAEMQRFYADLEQLINEKLTFEETLYYASMLHLVFVKIHPYNDGNGRCARLLEKWFLAEKLGEKAWLLQSERFYYLQHHRYYSNIRQLGVEYENLNYMGALPFTLMLPTAINYKD